MQCGECGAKEAPFLCSRCRVVRFCSETCQRAAWRRHRVTCRAAELNGICKISLPPAGPDEWIHIQSFDAFPGQDAGSCDAYDLDQVKKLCSDSGRSGFVVWNQKAFFRKHAAAELVANMTRAPGSTLYLHVPSMTKSALGSHALPETCAEVLVEGASQVEKRCDVSTQEMTQRFLQSRPVVLTDAQANWPARHKWSFEYFAKNFGSQEMPVSDLAPFFVHCDRPHITTAHVSMLEYVRYVFGQSNSLRALQKNDEQVFYANAWCPFSSDESLLEDVSDRLYCVQDIIPREAKTFNLSLTKVFLGPAGCISRLHHDTYATHVWLSQIRGRKQFICYPPEDSDKFCDHHLEDVDGRTSLFNPASPDYEAYPKAKSAKAFSVIVEEGETVVLPSKWWHWAKSLTPSITLMRNFINEVNFEEYTKIKKSAEASKTARNHDRSVT